MYAGRVWDTETAQLPSGESFSAVPSPKRMGGEPSILRMATALFGPTGSLPSSNKTDWPSGERSFARLQSYQERS